MLLSTTMLISIYSLHESLRTNKKALNEILYKCCHCGRDLFFIGIGA